MSRLSHDGHATLFDVLRTSNFEVEVNIEPSADLAGRVVIVTGAGSGIGRAAAHAFANAGARVLGVGRRKDALEETTAGYPAIAVHPADLNAAGAAENVVGAAIDRWGQLDVLVNNAGATKVMALADTTATGITALFDVNVVAPSLLARAALAHLRRSRGAIVNVSSTYGHRPLPGAAHYAASKAAIEQLTRSWAVELAADGIRVNALAPGPTESQALAAAGLPETTIEQIKQDEAARIPLGRRGDPDEVAGWILRLADPATTWLTGQVLTIDGGLELT
jgi:NAD(P)-dependent dehydrogenase (short-subunit alcohol dehydrogenase family)